MKDPISGLRAACTKLIKTNFAPPPPFSNETTTLATRDVLMNPRDPAGCEAARLTRHIRKRLFDFI